MGSVTLHWRGHDIELVTAPGVFSYRRVDKGTLLLIDQMEIREGGTVLDLGCGYGPVAVCASLLGSRVVALDRNRRAAWLCARNLETHAKASWAVVLGDLYGPLRGRFDAVLCNPPIRAGRGTVSRIISTAPKYLREGGSLELVARTKMGAKTLSSLMKHSFGNVEEKERRSGYRVLLSICRGGRVD